MCCDRPVRRKTMDLQPDGAALSIARICKIVAYVKAGINWTRPSMAHIRAQLRFLSFTEDCTERCPSPYFRLKG
jgi:hypothetical protein